MNISESTERAILGSILFDHELLDQTASLESSAFSLSSHQQIFLAMRRMAKAGKTIDLVTLLEALTAQGIIASVGGASYLAPLTEGLPRRRNIGEYVDSLHKQWQRRQLVKICEQYGSRASSGDEDAADLVAAADKDLLSIVADSDTEWPSVEVQTHFELAVMAEQRSGILPLRCMARSPGESANNYHSVVMVVMMVMTPTMVAIRLCIRRSREEGDESEYQ